MNAIFVVLYTVLVFAGESKSQNDIEETLRRVVEELEILQHNYETIKVENVNMNSELMEVKQQLMDSRSQEETPVGFYAYVSEHTELTDGSILIFDTNADKCWRCLFDRYRNFHSTLSLFFLTRDGGQTDLEIRVNDVIQCRGYGYHADGYVNTGACSVVVALSAGDLVNVKLRENHGDDGGVVFADKYTGFSGVLHYAL